MPKIHGDEHQSTSPSGVAEGKNGQFAGPHAAAGGGKTAGSATAAFAFHGLALGPGEQGEGDCPLCGKDRKLRVATSTGLWWCMSCGEKGNPLEFLRSLWTSAAAPDPDSLGMLTADRKLLDPETLTAWGMRLSPITGEWLLPGWSGDGKLNQLYRYAEIEGRMQLRASPGFPQQLMGPHPFDLKGFDVINVTEGPWDGMALWETLRAAGSKEGVIAVPSCTVFREKWATLFRGKEARLLFDNDHPRLHPKTGREVGLQGWRGMLRAAALIKGSTKRVKVLRWGAEHHDPDKPSGWDVRDHLAQGTTPRQRIALAEEIIGMTVDAPVEHGGVIAVNGDGSDAGTEPCESWKELQNAWRKAMKWDAPGEGLDAMLSVCLASVLSTETRGPQLWVLGMGAPSSGKTEICDALSTNKRYVILKDNIRGFHSGFDTTGRGEEDNSLLARMLGKTLVSKEGGVLLQAPNKEQILGEARDIFDRKTGIFYRNKVQRDYDKLSAGWILMGTSAMRALDSSDLGERFIRIRLNDIDEETEEEIGWMSLNRTDEECCFLMSEEMPDHSAAKDMEHAKALTGGYVSFLRENVKGLMTSISFSPEQKRRCQYLGWFAAFMRSRPNPGQQEVKERERHYRLSNQMVKLARALAAVTGRKEVDDSVMLVIRKVALDTAQGRTMDIVRWIVQKGGSKGLPLATIAALTNHDEEGEGKLVGFMRKIGILERIDAPSMLRETASSKRWRLTPRLNELYKEIADA